jgi:hypothetical protein
VPFLINGSRGFAELEEPAPALERSRASMIVFVDRDTLVLFHDSARYSGMNVTLRTEKSVAFKLNRMTLEALEGKSAISCMCGASMQQAGDANGTTLFLC